MLKSDNMTDYDGDVGSAAFLKLGITQFSAIKPLVDESCNKHESITELAKLYISMAYLKYSC